MKKFISVLLSIIISFGCFDLSVFAVTDEEEMMAIMEEKTCFKYECKLQNY